MQWHDMIGTGGVLCILLAYLLLQLEKLGSQSSTFSLLNAIGAALILVSLSQAFNLSAFLIEFFWLLISLFGLAKAFRRRGTTID